MISGGLAYQQTLYPFYCIDCGAWAIKLTKGKNFDGDEEKLLVVENKEIGG